MGHENGHLREKLRAKTVGRTRVGTHQREIVEWAGDDYEIRAPSVGERFEVLEAVGITRITSDMSPEQTKRFYLEMLIRFVYAPGDNRPLFERTDAEALLAESVDGDGFIDRFVATATRLFRGAKAAESGKESATSPNVASSTT